MNAQVVSYLVYVLLSVLLTVWVGTMLSRHGKVFLAEVFRGNERLVGSVNQLLVVGFYLLNFGFVALWLNSGDTVTTAREAVEMLSLKLGTVLVVVGVLHIVNLMVLTSMRRRAMVEARFADLSARTPSPVAVANQWTR